MSEPPPSLASLRRQTPARRRPEAQPAMPGLFDSVPHQEIPTARVGPAESTQSAAAQPLAVQRAIAGPGTPPRPTPAPAPALWTVSGLVRHVRGVVERDFRQLSLEAEISNWRPAGSGHCYFTLKDNGAQLSAVMFRRQASLLRFQPRDGDAVKVTGDLSVYEGRGQMQIIVEWMQQAGLGAMLAEVQRLKERLRQAGLFDRKRSLPAFPHCIGVVTSLQGAALRDIIKVCRRRHANVQLLIYPATVQGPNCAAEIAAGLRWFNAHPDQAEVVLLARGGGSWEDLHGFDDERVVRAIASGVLPVITGIGHATDSTIADAAADVCAPTPSAAAELLTSAQHRIEERLASLESRLRRAGPHELLRSQQRLGRLGARAVLQRVEDGLNRRAQRLDELQFRAQTALNRNLRTLINRHNAGSGRLARHNPSLRIPAGRQRLQELQARLQGALALRMARPQRRMEASLARLETLSPLRVLDRGYALVYGKGERLLRAPEEASPGEAIRARLAGGWLHARVQPSPLEVKSGEMAKED